jgi:hypothetical protein
MAHGSIGSYGKNPVTPPGIDSKTIRLVAQCLNHYATPGPIIGVIIIIGIQPLGRFGQRPELSQATGVALVRCILGKFLGVGCQYFPPLF